MASKTIFDAAPPFPNDIPTISMNKVRLAGLQAQDAETEQQLFAACQELGFFFLDLQGDKTGDEMIKSIDELFRLGKDIFNLPEDVKQQYLHEAPKSFLGFKKRGEAKTETNEPDRFEWFNIGQDGLMGNADLQPLPPFILENIEAFKSFMKYSQQVASVVNYVLAKRLSLPEDALASAQRPSEQSGTVIRLIKAFASPEQDDLRTSMVHHTDFGTITLLANIIGGLQILPPGASALDESAWRWVRPEPGCLIVNLGDATVQWSGGLLRSTVHRIKYPPGDQRFVNRYSLAALFRPERNVSMKPKLNVDAGIVEDTELSAWEWEVKKTMALVRGEEVMESKGGNQVTAA